MRESELSSDLRLRVFLIVFGALAAVCLWALAESWGADVLGARAFIALFSLALVFFSVSLVLVGPLPTGRALGAALGMAVPVALLISWAGLRYAGAREFFDTPYALVAAVILVVFATPFIAVRLRDPGQGLSYPALFDMAWDIAVRYLSGWLFVLVFWLVVFLSNGLLELVGIDVIEVLFEIDWVRFALSGAALGLGLAVAWEFRAFVSPLLLLRLMRLFLPLVLVVVAVFLLMLPVRGLSELFGDFSSAATLMAVAIAAISLISIALDRDDAAGVQGRGMRLAARALALAVPALGALAVWAVVLRVAQYGWTPDRVLAAAIALVLTLYGLLYALAVLLSADWRGAIRRTNIRMAVLVVAVSALWLTPLLHAERIAAQSQLERYRSGAATVDQLPLYEMAHDWGEAGLAALAGLRASADDGDPVLRDRLAALDRAETRYGFEQAVRAVRARGGIDQLVPLIAVCPEGARPLTAEMFADVPDYRLEQWQQGCARAAEDIPRCVWISGPFLPGIAARDQAIFLYAGPGERAVAEHLVLEDGRILDRVRALFDLRSGDWVEVPVETIARIAAGDFTLVPSGLQALSVGGLTLVPGN